MHGQIAQTLGKEKHSGIVTPPKSAREFATRIWTHSLLACFADATQGFGRLGKFLAVKCNLRRGVALTLVLVLVL